MTDVTLQLQVCRDADLFHSAFQLLAATPTLPTFSTLPRDVSVMAPAMAMSLLSMPTRLAPWWASPATA